MDLRLGHEEAAKGEDENGEKRGRAEGRERRGRRGKGEGKQGELISLYRSTMSSS